MITGIDGNIDEVVENLKRVSLKAEKVYVRLELKGYGVEKQNVTMLMITSS